MVSTSKDCESVVVVEGASVVLVVEVSGGVEASATVPDLIVDHNS
jgi:hypothetical protein